jgi:hypothetical protein
VGALARGSNTRTAQGVVPDGEHGGLMILRLDRSLVPDLSVESPGRTAAATPGGAASGSPSPFRPSSCRRTGYEGLVPNGANGRIPQRGAELFARGVTAVGRGTPSFRRRRNHTLGRTIG